MCKKYSKNAAKLLKKDGMMTEKTEKNLFFTIFFVILQTLVSSNIKKLKLYEKNLFCTDVLGKSGNDDGLRWRQKG